SFDFARKENVDAAVRRLLLLARQVRVSRDIDALDTISELILESFNGSPFAEVARFHKAHCLQSRGDVLTGRKLLNEVIERVGSNKFRARALLALGSSYRDAGEYSECRPLYLQAVRAVDESDPLTRIQSIRAVAIVRAIEGDHFGSLSALQSLLPQNVYLGRWYPADLYDHLNSIAIELGELGRVEEATRIIDRVLRTPFAKNCPHWLDTKTELATKRRLVFPPFTIALGAPAAPPETESEAPTEPHERATEYRPVAPAEAQTDGAWSADRNPCRRAKIAVIRLIERQQHDVSVISTKRTCALKDLNPLLVRAEQGYAVSPPARAPPANSRNFPTS
ncbi:MAG: tetratricopeptide repeat protein, partial [Blastocatellia bacterium]